MGRLWTASPAGMPAAVTLASLVEREAEVDSDRPLIAAVYLNRLKKRMRLQCDATVQYALPEHKSRLFYADLRVDSPYNTYKSRGPAADAHREPRPAQHRSRAAPGRRVNYLYYVARSRRASRLQRTPWPATSLRTAWKALGADAASPLESLCLRALDTPACRQSRHWPQCANTMSTFWNALNPCQVVESVKELEPARPQSAGHCRPLSPI